MNLQQNGGGNSVPPAGYQNGQQQIGGVMYSAGPTTVQNGMPVAAGQPRQASGVGGLQSPIQGLTRGVPGNLMQQHLQQQSGRAIGQQHYGGMGMTNGIQGRGMPQGAAQPYATSPQGMGRPINMQPNNMSSFQHSGVAGFGNAPRAAGTGVSGPVGYVPPSGDLLSMLNNKAPGGVHHQQREDGPAFSMSDFPSLSGTGAQTRSGAHDGDALGVLLGASKGVTQSPTFGEEDFPALPGAQSGSVLTRGAAAQQQAAMQPQIRVSNHQRDIGQQQASVSFGGMQGRKVGLVGTPLQQANERFGLLGLLSVIRMTDPDLTTLSLGTDLTTLGLNLNSPDALWRTFSPWAEGPLKQEIDARIPDSFLSPAPQLVAEHWQYFKPDTLFYIFYGMPGDDSQLRAAEELTRRGWMYHKELKTWLTRIPNTEPERKAERAEIGSFLVFDVSKWEIVRRDNFTLSFDALEDAPSLIIKAKNIRQPTIAT
eukprot:jgi/Picsp_1/4487/NSC_06708-R1_protein